MKGESENAPENILLYARKSIYPTMALSNRNGNSLNKCEINVGKHKETVTMLADHVIKAENLIRSSATRGRPN